MSISQKHMFLQVNATIIAGLLILLTITAISTESVLDLKIKSNILLKEYQMLLEEYPNIKKNIEITEGRQNATVTPNPDGSGIVFTMPPPPPDLYAQDSVIDEIFEENFRERVKTFATLQAHEELSNFEYLNANPVFLVSIIIVPFLCSILIEMHPFRFHTEHVSTVSLIVFAIGIISMIGFFGAGIIMTFLYA